MNSANRFLERLTKLADAGGWILVEYEAELPGHVVLVDNSGTRVTIESRAGVDLPYYLEQFKARPRDKAFKP